MSPRVNCFLLFCKDNRSLLATLNPGYSNADVTSVLGKHWRDLESSEKEIYIQRANKLNEEYKLKNPFQKKKKISNIQKMTFSFKVSTKSQSNKPRRNYETKNWRLNELNPTIEYPSPFFTGSQLFNTVQPNTPYLPLYFPPRPRYSRDNVKLDQQYYNSQPVYTCYQTYNTRNHYPYYIDYQN